MITQHQKVLLEQFFSGYFHEDWQYDAHDTKSVVSEYVKTGPLRDIGLLAEAILQYSAEFSNDGHLEKSLFDKTWVAIMTQA
jgi:hypothetical protein